MTNESGYSKLLLLKGRKKLSQKSNETLAYHLNDILNYIGMIKRNRKQHQQQQQKHNSSVVSNDDCDSGGGDDDDDDDDKKNDDDIELLIQHRTIKEYLIYLEQCNFTTKNIES